MWSLTAKEGGGRASSERQLLLNTESCESDWEVWSERWREKRGSLTGGRDWSEGEGGVTWGKCTDVLEKARNAARSLEREWLEWVSGGGGREMLNSEVKEEERRMAVQRDCGQQTYWITYSLSQIDELWEEVFLMKCCTFHFNLDVHRYNLL